MSLELIYTHTLLELMCVETHVQTFQTWCNESDLSGGEEGWHYQGDFYHCPDTMFITRIERHRERRLLAFLAVFVYLFLLLKFFFMRLP